MNIGNYRLADTEEATVLDIFENIKCSFPDVRFDYRKDIVGIGEANRYLMCYFSIRNNRVYVKFKTKAWLTLDDSEAIQDDLAETVELFKNGGFWLKRARRTHYAGENATRQGDSTESSKHIEEKFRVFTKAIQLVPEGKQDVSFNYCSRRLKNALYNHEIVTVKDLQGRSPAQIMQIPQLGRKSFNELCNFLLSLSDDTLAVQDTCAPASADLEIQEKITFIKENRRRIALHLEEDVVDVDDEVYSSLYVDLINHIYETASLRLPPRELAMILSRFGINEPAKTLQEIGDLHSLSRERVRQLLNKAVRRMGYRRKLTDELVDLEFRKVLLVSQIAEFSAGKFLAFLLLQDASVSLVQFVCQHYFYNPIDVPGFKRLLNAEISLKRQQEIMLAKSCAYNESIYQHIIFPGNRRCITEEDFSRLKTERIVSTQDDELKFFTFNDTKYQCESNSQKRVLSNLLIHNTFKSVKTQSIKIPIKDSFCLPDFQCLTHDNNLVIIEIKPLLRMCEHESIEKFKAIRQYCAKYGFGYLIVDDRGISFEHVESENSEFFEGVLSEIDQHGHIAYNQYKQIYSQTNASVKNLLTLIKRYDLHFSFPFLLER